MAENAQIAGHKRKQAPNHSASSSSAQKRIKRHDARAIPVQRSQPALSAAGELNIASFVKAREFELDAIDRSIVKARTALSTRAFQQVPRNMRRRTASHNAKKVPRRLRPRAIREMKEDNTPVVNKRTRQPSNKLRLRLERAKLLQSMNRHTKTVRQRKREAKANLNQPDPENHVSLSHIPRPKTSKLAQAPRATTKYKKRQVNKTWLPTHLWHTKRAHMPRPTQPLWRMAIPLSPTEKSYRPSHRAAGARGCIAWDSSYMSTVSCRGTLSALEKLLSALSFNPDLTSSALLKKWKAGTRFAQGWLHERDAKTRPIAPAVVLWCSNSEKKDPDVELSAENGQAHGSDKPNGKSRLDHQLLIRVHPSAFHHFWEEILKAAKIQKPQVLVEDLRFEIGSIDVQGPGSTDALLGVLRPVSPERGKPSVHAATWTSLIGLTNPATISQNAVLSFSITDSRLHHPPKQLKSSTDGMQNSLTETLVSWPPDKTPTASPLLSHKERWRLVNSLLSQKAINRRKALSPPGQAPSSKSTDPHIPVIIIASRPEHSSQGIANHSQGTWTVLLPWQCVESVWRSLMYYPLTSGGTPRFGGLKQKQQLAFEQQSAWFPADAPGTEAGKAWERTESEKRFDEWIRRPPKHRIAWDKLDLGYARLGELGRGWCCDWEYLFESKAPPSHLTTPANPNQLSTDNTAKLLTRRHRKAAENSHNTEADNRRRNTSSPETDTEIVDAPLVKPDTPFAQLDPTAGVSILKHPDLNRLPSSPVLLTIRITFLDRGTPAAGARVYRLPTPIVNGAAESRSVASDYPSQHDQAAWGSSDLPPPQPHSSRVSVDRSSSPTTKCPDIRKAWLALIRSTSASGRLPKQHTNRFNLPTKQSAYLRESLAQINVLPKNAPQEIVDKFGPNSVFGRGDGETPKLTRTKNKKMTEDKQVANATSAPTSSDARIQVQAELQPQAAHLKTVTTLFNVVGPESPWDKHPPVPDRQHLLGFVTSGGYNLAEGRGTAIGSIWAQRLLEGWAVEDAATARDPTSHTVKYLCIVRNAGESIGRLARWEVCQSCK
ncbi:hypothetical protein PV10_05901 [Exophiala mesophila]|uniref:Uncharacterized protein n=1 Tax=Exophiala mesophila TaxID=212818 RepID=A0A0D1WQI1_EXOME|nr:uncharacterized protein PV10_05901 [Exophiala mesophila]KIV91355.1 hypothetical protein PV10_05901 [Exophiala mesophila]